MKIIADKTNWVLMFPESCIFCGKIRKAVKKNEWKLLQTETKNFEINIKKYANWLDDEKMLQKTSNIDLIAKKRAKKTPEEIEKEMNQQNNSRKQTGRETDRETEREGEERDTERDRETQRETERSVSTSFWKHRRIFSDKYHWYERSA